MFSVVVFEGPKESVGTIPTKWLNQTKSECKWPVKDIQNSIKTTRILTKVGTLIQFVSYRKSRLIFSSDEPKSDESEVSLTPSMISLVAPSEDEVEDHVGEAALLNNLASATEDTAAQRQPQNPQQPSPSSTTQESNLNYAVLFNRQIAFEKQVLTVLSEIKADIRELLHRSSNSSPAEELSLKTIPFDLPVQTSDILVNLNNWATHVESFNSLVNFLSSIGGSDVGKIVRNILARLISGTLARQINYTGAHEKISFDSLVLKKAVIAAVRCNKGFECETEVKIKSAIQNWFRNSRDLEGGHKQRKQKNVVVQEILKPNVINPEGLPLSAKTLLKTPRTIQMTAIGGGKFYYFGVSKKIVRCINEGLTSFQYPLFRNVDIENLITLSISTDGIPIFKSSNIQMWPLLFKIDQALQPKPQVAGIFCGETKPSDIKQFMSEFVSEMLTLEKEGLLVNGQTFNVRISCVIADAPARSFVKCIKGHTAYHGCERCIDEGEWQKRIIYSVYSSKLRTDKGFIIQEDKDHHVGVMRKLVFLWLSGPVSVKLSVKQVREVSMRLEKCKMLMPIEFNRKPRSLRDINRFKATEYRTLLLYTGPLVFRGILKDKVYRHFMLFSCAFRIFLSDKVYNSNWLTYARKLIEKFVCSMKDIYGSSIKRMVRGHYLPLEQVVKRVLEQEACDQNVPLECNKKSIYSNKQVVIRGATLKACGSENFALSKATRDSVFVTLDGNIFTP
ncbi:hypothetical protein Ocin01_09266 [Orchesella cincta]|uniref:DUF4806 domain-containing protein n=1 Tax=Orchesella cincta TaxID=48709 RepID=A0A1D2MX84_ORCCI|nr:hypothetical protein Ocin01_09266 [Orchesella cincta]